MRVRAAIIGVLAVVVSACATEPRTEPWLNEASIDLQMEKTAEAISSDQYFEIPASKLDTAEVRLADEAILPEGEAGSARYFGHAEFQCAPPRQAHLVRAVYENGGTGVFELTRHGSVLLITHNSLGAASSVQRTALFACLDFTPTEVFHALRGAL